MATVPCIRVLQYVRVSFLLGLHALFVLLTLARATGDDAWDWYFAFIPLFVFDALSIVYWIHYLISYIAVKRGSNVRWIGRNSVLPPGGLSFSLRHLMAYGVGIPLKVVAEVLLMLHLQHPENIRVFVPAVLFMLLFLEVGVVAVCTAVAPMVKTFRNTPS